MRLVIQDKDNVTIPRGEYDKLRTALNSLELLAASQDKYGPDREVFRCVMKSIGREYVPEAADA